MAQSPAQHMARDCLVGFTGFVGQCLMRQRSFQGLYNSANIDALGDEEYATLICAAAPATMWAANANPEADKANLDQIAKAVIGAKAERVVLISTIAVFDDPAAGYTESSAQFEEAKAYGRHRRELEVALGEQVEQLHVIRLPALFAAGLKKNFIFDLINPVPSFLRPEVYERLEKVVDGEAIRALEISYSFRPDLEMWELDRAKLEASGLRPVLEQEIEDQGRAARNFTNSESRFQYYNVERLAADIDRMIAQGIGVLNVCSEPLKAKDICLALTGLEFDNSSAGIYREDVRSGHAEHFGGAGPYLYSREQVLEDLSAFYQSATRP